jgi:hypothetical protein
LLFCKLIITKTATTTIIKTTHYTGTDITIDKIIIHNRPDITFVDKRNKTTYLFDISIPNKRNVQRAHRKNEELSAFSRRNSEHMAAR